MRLTLRHMDNKRIYELETEGGTLGSSGRATMVVQDPSILAEHARFVFDGSRWIVEPLGNKPVYLEGKPFSRRTFLAAKGELQVGNTMFAYWQDGAYDEANSAGLPETTVRRPLQLEVIKRAGQGAAPVTTLVNRPTAPREPVPPTTPPAGNQHNGAVSTLVVPPTTPTAKPRSAAEAISQTHPGGGAPPAGSNQRFVQVSVPEQITIVGPPEGFSPPPPVRPSAGRRSPQVPTTQASPPMGSSDEGTLPPQTPHHPRGASDVVTVVLSGGNKAPEPQASYSAQPQWGLPANPPRTPQVGPPRPVHAYDPLPEERRRDWTPLLHLCVLLGILALVTLVTFVVGVRYADPIPGFASAGPGPS